VADKQVCCSVRPQGEPEPIDRERDLIPPQPGGGYLASMEVHLTDDQRALVREAIQAGLFVTEEDALQETLVAVM
jgi:hypothetical protein